MQQLSLESPFFLLPAVKSCSPLEVPRGGTRDRQTSKPASPPCAHPLHALPLHCLPAASLICAFRIFFPFSSPSPRFIFMPSNCLLWRLMQHPTPPTHPPLHTRTRPCIRSQKRKGARCPSTQVDWWKGSKVHRHFFSFALTRARHNCVLKQHRSNETKFIEQFVSPWCIWRSDVYIFFSLFCGITPHQRFGPEIWLAGKQTIPL